MNFKIISSSITTLLLSLSIQSYATELDDYFIQNQLIEQNYKIKDSKNLDDVLNALSDEDSRVLPVQIDQNTVIEKIRLYHDHIDLEGLITSENFKHFADSMVKEKTQQFLLKGMLENCGLIFENEFQRRNPYYVKMKLSSAEKVYELKLKNDQCQF